MQTNETTTQATKITIAKNGPYLVSGSIDLVHRTQITSEHGEPMTWRTNGAVETGNGPKYALCRCGGSSNKPFCDGTHAKIGFDGAETAATNTFDERKIVHECHPIPIGDDTLDHRALVREGTF